jgi:hypothetical protein
VVEEGRELKLLEVRGGVKYYEHFYHFLTPIYKIQLYQHYVINVSSIYHEHINISGITTHQIHSTPEFTWKKKWEKTTKCFLIYFQEYIHWKHQLPNSTATIERRIQPPIYRLQPKGSYNSLNYLAPTRRRLQPPDSQAPT